MDSLSFLFESPLGKLIIIIVVVLLIFLIIKSLFKLALIIFAIGLLFFGFFYIAPPEFVGEKLKVKELTDEFVIEKVKPILLKELESAEIEKNEDGSFVLKSQNLEWVQSSDGKINIRLATINAEFTLEELKKFLNSEEIELITKKVEERIKQEATLK